MTFCTKCGAPQTPGAVFCTGCGARQAPATNSPVPSLAQPAAPSSYVPMGGAPVAASAPSTKQGNGLRNFIIIAVVCLVILIAAGIAGSIYAVRLAKAKAESVYHQIAPDTAPQSTPPSESAPSPGTSSDAPAATAAVPAPAASSFPQWQPSSAAVPVGGPAPPKEGMLVITAIADAQGDYESMKQIQSIDATGTTVSYHSEKPKPEAGTAAANASSQEVNITRLVLPQDLKTAHEYAELFGTNDPKSFPGTTAVTASQEVLAELKQKGSTTFSFRPDGLKGAIGSLVSMFSQFGATDKKDPDTAALEKFQKEQCDLKREGTGLFAFPVLLNDQPVTLPALRADCVTDDGPADFYILDQPDYPLMLSWKLGSGSQLQVIKITYPPARKHEEKAAPNAIEQQLKEKKKVDIYGIYFDFGSDHLKPESTPVLDEIAGVLKDNPDWNLTVSGHTDNIGGDPYNLDLSQRRAAAVKMALVTRYHVAPDRLKTDGFGASRPVDTNETLAGRARNRRVELTRE